jgi:hypothetical protein
MTLHLINGIKVRTSNCILSDWSAIDDATYDGERCEIGRGATEQEAIDDLIWQIEERFA